MGIWYVPLYKMLRCNFVPNQLNHKIIVSIKIVLTKYLQWISASFKNYHIQWSHNFLFYGSKGGKETPDFISLLPYNYYYCCWIVDVKRAERRTTNSNSWSNSSTSVIQLERTHSVWWNNFPVTSYFVAFFCLIVHRQTYQCVETCYCSVVVDVVLPTSVVGEISFCFHVVLFLPFFY